jgi:hypothetical protein
MRSPDVSGWSSRPVRLCSIGTGRLRPRGLRPVAPTSSATLLLMAAAAENLTERSALAEQLAMQQGFALVGIAPAQPSAFAEHLRRWLAQGQHGQMHYLADPQRLDQMLDPAQFVPGAQSIVCVADRYA